MKRASLEQRKTAASAMSPTSPNRPSGVCSTTEATAAPASGASSCRDYVVGQLHAHVGGDKPGIETVDPHAVTKLACFHRGNPRHAVNGRFRAGVSRNGRKCDGGRNRGDIDDGAAGTCTSARSHRAKRVFHAETGADDVDVAHPAQILGLEIDDERGDLDACIVDQYVVATERGDGGCDSLFPLRVVGDVQFYEAGLGACFCKTAGGFLAEIGENIADHHSSAGVRKRLCDRSADASRAASDQSLAARQSFFAHRVLLPL